MFCGMSYDTSRPNKISYFQSLLHQSPRVVLRSKCRTKFHKICKNTSAASSFYSIVEIKLTLKRHRCSRYLEHGTKFLSIAIRGVFTTLSSIYDGNFFQKLLITKNIIRFRKKLLHRCFTGS